MFQFSFFRLWRRGRRSRPANSVLARKSRLRAILRVEELEVRAVPSSNTISGFVFSDANNNGLYDAGETPIANSPISLLNSAGTVIGSTHTDSTGHYSFATDNSIPVNPATATHEASFPDNTTDWSNTKTVAQFDPSLGTLTQVDITVTGTFTSEIEVENMSPMLSKVIGTVSGSLAVTGPGTTSVQVNSSTSQTFNASAFDGTLDFGGTSGHDFGQQTTPPGTKTVTLTGAGDLALFTGTSTVSVTASTAAASTGSGSGNLVTMVSSTAAADVIVTYHYLPSSGLLPGNYTVVQTSEPQGYLDGLESSGGVVIPNTIGTDFIHVTLTNNDSTNNNFGELLPASLSGYVYVDANNNGSKDAGEAGIGGATVSLSGTDDMGHTVSATQSTASDGSYQFTGLRPGTYAVKETQPANYLDGKDTVGSAGGNMSNDLLSNIVLGPGAGGVNYNFGELLPASLAGFVYVDANNNGIKEAGEPGIAGVAVSLTGTDDLGHTVSAAQSTGQDGSYNFANLRPGTYAIAETQPASYPRRQGQHRHPRRQHEQRSVLEHRAGFWYCRRR